MSGTTAVLLIHGGGANARWWDAVVPLLGDRPVAAMDLSGHGDAPWYEEYSAEQWTAEVVAAARALPGRPLLVGHSMGGLLAILAAVELGTEVAGVVALDSPLNEHADLQALPMDVRPPRVYPERGLMVERFRPLMDIGVADPALLRHVAEHSITEVEGGFRWNTDPRFRPAGQLGDVLVTRTACPVWFIRPEHGISTDAMLDQARRGGADLRVIDLAGAGHNAMLDNPSGLAREIEGVLALSEGED